MRKSHILWTLGILIAAGAVATAVYSSRVASCEMMLQVKICPDGTEVPGRQVSRFSCEIEFAACPGE